MLLDADDGYLHGTPYDGGPARCGTVYGLSQDGTGLQFLC